MANALITAIQSMQNDLHYMDMVSQNMVNATTPGYKRAIPTTKPLAQLFEKAMRTAQPAEAADAGKQISELVPAMGSVLDMSAGPVKQTGKPWDLAISGDGYFELAAPDGPAYSRAGDFHLDGNGRLLSSQGYAVQGQGGDIVVRGSEVSVDHLGRVLQGGDVVAQVKIMQFADPKGLLKTATGLLRAADPKNSVTEAKSEVQVGYLENSNVTPMREMIAMMETTRHFESAQKLFQGYDDMLNTAIQKLGEF